MSTRGDGRVSCAIKPAYASIGQKKLRLVGQAGDVWEDGQEAGPDSLRQARPQSPLGALPGREGLFQLGDPGGGDHEQLLAVVFAGPDGQPAALQERAEVAS